jgi:hypothetical protein
LHSGRRLTVGRTIKEHVHGDVRYTCWGEVSHIKLIFFNRSFARVAVRQEERRPPKPFRWYDPSTWFQQDRWVAAGSAAIVDYWAFYDGVGRDISDRLDLTVQRGEGWVQAWVLFVHAIIVSTENKRPPQLTDLKNDARSVKKVSLTYKLPWETEARTIYAS